MKLFFYCLFVILLVLLHIGCETTTSKPNSYQSHEIASSNTTKFDLGSVSSSLGTASSDTTIIEGFFKKANACPLNYYSGGLDEGEADVLCADEQFTLVFVSKDTSAEVYVDDLIFKKAPNHVRTLTNDYTVYNQFDCYAFVYPHGKLKDDIFGVNAKFPFIVSGYKRITGDKWQKIGAMKVNTNDEFNKFEGQVEM